MTEFKIEISNETRSYTFDVYKDEEDKDTVHYYIGQPKRTYLSCVHIEVDTKYNYAVLQRLHPVEKCSINADMAAIPENTHLLLKGTLKYVLEQHPNITHYTLDDKAEKRLRNGKYIIVTARLLLQGRKGWYQRHFGAIPTPDTERIINEIASNQELVTRNLNITTRNGWGDDHEIVEMARLIAPKHSNSILGTSWIIPAESVNNYVINVREVPTGGGLKRSAQNMQKVYANYSKVYHDQRGYFNVHRV